MKQSDLAELCRCFRRVASIIERIDLGCASNPMRVLISLTAAVEELNRAAQGNYQTFFQDQRSTGEWYGTVSTDVAAKYLGEQIALALAQRASGEKVLSEKTA